jgi:hypothetical protein
VKERRSRSIRGSRHRATDMPERVADVLSTIVAAVDGVRRIVNDPPEATADTSPTAEDDRDSEVARVLAGIARRLQDRDRMVGISRDVALAAVELYAAPYALALYYEIRRLDRALTLISRPERPERNL